MRSSSAQQLQLDFEIAAPRQTSSGSTRFAQSDAVSHESRGTSANITFPDFGTHGSVLEATSRHAGRLNAANISEQEYQLLLREREQLLDKKFAGTATRQELNRLEYVRWSLDRIEDAKYGASLDLLEGSVSMYESFLAEVRTLYQRLWERTAKRPK